ncbi:MAG: MFS transporter [Chitinophagaceae bacterium]|nr:MFS transporter [Chitinophagaceae bacterium]
MVRKKIVGYVAFTFLAYFIIGLALPILPVFVTHDLGYSTMIAGIVISTQYIMTFLCRGYAGSIVDKKGPKLAIMRGMIGFTISGAILVMVHLLGGYPAISLAILACTRLITGFGEGLVGSSPINWAILATGEENTARAISFNGIASYGALAAGAPCGVIIQRHFGLGTVGILIVAVGLLGIAYARYKPALKAGAGKQRQPFVKVLRQVAPYGTCMALGGLGFGGISTFITLYYASLHWQGAVLCLCLFSMLFITGRLTFPNAINRFGGLRTSIVCLSVETLGLFVLWQATVPFAAAAGAGLAGLGFSLVYPALGVEAVRLVPSSNKGTALAAYGLFIDLSLGVTGPLLGAFAGHFGMRHIYAFAMLMVLSGLALAIGRYRRPEWSL